MKKKELLAPVGNCETLVQAVLNGADAVYLAGKKFGARAFANNFTNEELQWAIKFCHLYGVKIYVTINTMIYEDEMNECLNFIRFLHQSNVDAVILQDLGLIKIVREKFPNLEIHASTQMHNHNQEQLNWYKQMGIKRVVLARELSLKEINNFKTDLELEIFIHGALCISYSGQCLFSSLLMDRSGNRGSCAGICRLPFSLYEDNKLIPTEGNYLLSPKELCTLNDFEKIMASNIDSLKIEGRMKSPYYVGFITRLYRTLIDSYEQNHTCKVGEEDFKKLKVLFNRGFTNGFLFDANFKDLMNIKTSNHQGIYLGEISQITAQKIKIKLQEDLHQEDGIRFVSEDKGMIVNFLYNEKGLLIKGAKKGENIYIDNKINLQKKGKVLKTVDYKLENSLKKLPERKIKISGDMTLKVGKRIVLTFNDGHNIIEKQGSIVEKAQNTAVSKEIIVKKINSLGNTPFILDQINIDMDDNIFISMSELKQMRREAIQELTQKRENIIPHDFLETKINILPEKRYNKPSSYTNINVLVRTEEQLQAVLKAQVNSIYITNEKLYQKYQLEKNIYYRLPRVKSNFNIFNNQNLLVEETGSLYKYHGNNNLVTDYSFNISNSFSFNLLSDMQVERITLSIENKLEDIRNIAAHLINKNQIEVYLYGRPEVMIMKYCPLNNLVNHEEKCNVCQNKHQYFLKDRNQKLYPIISNIAENHLTHLLYYKPLNRLKELHEYLNMGIVNFRVEFFDETPEEIESIISKIKSVNF